MTSERRPRLTATVKYCALAAILLMPAQLAWAESVWQFTVVNHQAFAAIGRTDGGDDESISSETTPTASATVGTEAGLAYADSFSGYSLSNNNSTATFEGHVTAHGGPALPGGGYAYGGGSTDIVVSQQVTRPTRLHIVGTMTRSILAGPDDAEYGRPAIEGDFSGTPYLRSLSSGPGTISFDDIIDVSAGLFGFRIREMYRSGVASPNSYGSGSNSYSISITMTDVPEPSTLILLGIGAVSLLGYAWRRHAIHA